VSEPLFLHSNLTGIAVPVCSLEAISEGSITDSNDQSMDLCAYEVMVKATKARRVNTFFICLFLKTKYTAFNS
jgi:hypothetical protein